MNNGFGLQTAEYISARTGIEADRLTELANAGYVPHYQLDGKGPFFKVREVQAWVKDNLLQVLTGLPMPTKAIICTQARPQSGVPLRLAGIGGLQYLPMPIPVSAIYFLVFRGEVVYVGQTANVAVRVAHHAASNKEFDEAWFLPMPISQLNQAEMAYIDLFTPRYNYNAKGQLLKNSHHRR